MIKKNYLYIEKFYPYIISLMIVIIACKFKINLMKSKNFSNIIISLISANAIIIGFLGALLPIIMTLKENSSLVRKVFEMDKNQLFKKYFKHTIFVGIFNILNSLLILANDLDKIEKSKLIYYIWIMSTICFYMLILRIINFIIEFIFTNDIKSEKFENKKRKNSKEDIDSMEKKYSNKNDY